MQFKIAVLPGDGIGGEVTAESVKTLQSVGRKFGHNFVLDYGLIGGTAIERTGKAISSATLKTCQNSEAVVLGAVGGNDDPRSKVNPLDGVLVLRKELGLFANLRPVRVCPCLINSTRLKPEVVEGVDLLVIRELTGGLYYGQPKKQWRTPQGRWAIDSMLYSEQEIERIVRVAFELARRRRKKLTSVDKANVLQCSRLWRQVAIEVANEYPDVELEHILVDACAMRLIQNPKHFDVIVTENTFGDIITDEASMLAGSMGMLPSASLAGMPQEGAKIFGLYEPIHGSAPRRAGLDMANPIAAILSVAMMLRYSFGLTEEADIVEAAVDTVLGEGYRTYDIMGEGNRKVGTKEMGDLIAENIEG